MKITTEVQDVSGASERQLLKYDVAVRAVADAKSVDEAKDIRDRVEAMRIYAHQAGNRSMEIDAAEIRMRAERRLGELIRTQKESQGLNVGGRPPKTGGESEQVSVPSLRELGIGRRLSSEAQQIAEIPEPEFEETLVKWRSKVEATANRVTTKILREREKRSRQQERQTRHLGGSVDELEVMAARGNRFGVIYADPPWRFENWSEEGEDRSALQHYETQTVNEIASLPVEELAANDCVLLLWAIETMLQDALNVIFAWGFSYKTIGFHWVKSNRKRNTGFHMGLGYWTRANPEICLLATRGHPERLDRGVEKLVVTPVEEHSKKPEEVRRRIDRLVNGPYLELYGRGQAEGWTVWGDEAEGTGLGSAPQEGLTTVVGP